MKRPPELRDEWLAPVRLLYDQLPPPREPVSDEVYQGMRLQFTRSAEVLPRAEREQIAKSDLWTAELIDLFCPSGAKASLVLVLPRGRARPLQPIIYGPPWGCCLMKRPNREALEQLHRVEFVVNGGRALVLPIWTGSYERFATPDMLDGANAREAALGYYDDVTRIIDYLATRPDLDSDRIGYLGLSHGSANIGPVVLATEPRLQAAVLISGGIRLDRGSHPMLDPVNYAPRITQPVMMINGRFDPLYPYQESQSRMFALLGSPPGMKTHRVYDVGHTHFPHGCCQCMQDCARARCSRVRAPSTPRAFGRGLPASTGCWKHGS